LSSIFVRQILTFGQISATHLCAGYPDDIFDDTLVL